MLNPFPDLLMFSFVAPTLLRVAVALTFVYLAYLHAKDRHALGERLGPHGEKYIWAITVLYGLIAFSLFFGYYTQVGAVAAVLISAFHLFLRTHFPMHHDIARSTYYFLILISASLLLTGAGAFAFDIPL